MNRGEEERQHQFSSGSDTWGRRLPPWETGPEALRLPRYSKVIRPKLEEQNEVGTAKIGLEGESPCVGEDSMRLDARVASGLA